MHKLWIKQLNNTHYSFNIDGVYYDKHAMSNFTHTVLIALLQMGLSFKTLSYLLIEGKELDIVVIDRRVVFARIIG